VKYKFSGIFGFSVDDFHGLTAARLANEYFGGRRATRPDYRHLVIGSNEPINPLGILRTYCGALGVLMASFRDDHREAKSLKKSVLIRRGSDC
jgi:hypothetical protein